jgi:hypothetical protein
MQSNFTLFGITHLAILACVPLLAAACAWLDRSSQARREHVRLALAVALVVNAAVWYGYLAFRG